MSANHESIEKAIKLISDAAKGKMEKKSQHKLMAALNHLVAALRPRKRFDWTGWFRRYKKHIIGGVSLIAAVITIWKAFF